jgi:hypothetical protein
MKPGIVARVGGHDFPECPGRLTTGVLAGLVVSLALIPSGHRLLGHRGRGSVAGPACLFTMAVTIAFVGGRPAMIPAATGAIALVIAPLVGILWRGLLQRRGKPSPSMHLVTSMLTGAFKTLPADDKPVLHSDQGRSTGTRLPTDAAGNAASPNQSPARVTARTTPSPKTSSGTSRTVFPLPALPLRHRITTRVHAYIRWYNHTGIRES